MKRFFRQVEEISLENSPVNAEMYFRGENATGLIEKHLGDEKSAVMLFVNGEPGAAYLFERDKGKPMTLADFSALEVSHPRAIFLPDVAGRLMALALESQAEDRLSIADDESWVKRLAQWHQARWSGLVEIETQDFHGFSLFWQGEPQNSDLIFSTPQGFFGDFPRFSGAGAPAWQVVSYSYNASAHAYQYAALRLAAMRWSRAILSRYQEMVGQKLLQMMDRELARQIQPWRWNIVFDGRDMLDLHFFPYLADAAHAYRALFMTMGVQMDFVIGSALTQRILNETFEQVLPDERAVLQSQRLIPAAFSE